MEPIGLLLLALGVSRLLAGAAPAAEVEGLARILASETSKVAAWPTISWAVVHHARRLRRSIDRVARGTEGRYGRQGTGGRTWSSRQEATAESRRVAARVLSRAIPDPFGRIKPSRAFEPAVQDRLVAENAAAYELTAVDVDAKWRGEGLTRLVSPRGAEAWWFYGRA